LDRYYVPGLEMGTRKDTRKQQLQAKEGFVRRLEHRQGMSKSSYMKETLLFCTLVFSHGKIEIIVLPLPVFMQSNEAKYWICKISLWKFSVLFSH
jgi:hypothetical protein